MVEILRDERNRAMKQNNIQRIRNIRYSKSSGFTPAEEKTILIVDDDEGISRAFFPLCKQGYNADTANSGT